MPRKNSFTICNDELLEKFRRYNFKLEHFDPAPHLHFRKSRARLVGWLILYGCLKAGEVQTVRFEEVTGDYVVISYTRRNRRETQVLDIAPVYTIVVNWIKPIYKPRKPRPDMVIITDRQVQRICRQVFGVRCEDVRKACLSYYACEYGFDEAVKRYGSHRMAKQILQVTDTINELLGELKGVLGVIDTVRAENRHLGISDNYNGVGSFSSHQNVGKMNRKTGKKPTINHNLDEPIPNLL